MEWTTIKEILNYSTPLAGLVVVAWATWRGSKWVAVEVIKPVFGPKGAVVDYLVSQREGFVAQTQAMRDLTSAFRDAGTEAAKRIDELIEIAGKDRKEQSAIQSEVLDLLEIHDQWALAADSFCRQATEGNATPDLTCELCRIREITAKYLVNPQPISKKKNCE